MAALFATGGKIFQKVGLLSAESGHFCKYYSEGFWPLTFPSAVDLWFGPFLPDTNINNIFTGPEVSLSIVDNYDFKGI